MLLWCRPGPRDGEEAEVCRGLPRGEGPPLPPPGSFQVRVASKGLAGKKCAQKRGKRGRFEA